MTLHGGKKRLVLVLPAPLASSAETLLVNKMLHVFKISGVIALVQVAVQQIQIYLYRFKWD